MCSFRLWLLFAMAQLVHLSTAEHGEIEYERYDGWFNNLANPSWGAVVSPLSRVVPPMYEDGVYQPSGSSRPNPLDLSMSLMSSRLDNVTGALIETKSFRNASVMMVFFAQHVAHEIVDTSRPGCPPEHFNIKVPKGHPIYDKNNQGDKWMPFSRSNYDSASGTSPNTPRQQINEATPWLDGSAIYGTMKSWADSLRTLKDGKLDLSEKGNWPKENTMGLPMYNPAIPSTNELKDAKRILKLGDKRGNENPFLLSIGILWFRYHNVMAEKIKKNQPTWNDDRIFNEARKWVIATYQHIVFYEWLPAFLGPEFKNKLETEHKYNGYKNSIHPGVSHIFQSAAMRFGETMVPTEIYKAYANDCQYANSKYQKIRLCNNYWNAEETLKKEDVKEKDHVKAIVYGMVNQVAEAEDNIIVEDLRGFSYGPLDHSRRDLVAVNIQRGRDHGLPDYNTARKAFGLHSIDNFMDINNDHTVVSKKVLDEMAKLYNNDANNIDIWVGGMMESGKSGPGPLFYKVIVDQFLRLRDGDRFWYENYNQTNHFQQSEVEEIKKMTFKDIITNCTDITSDQLQDNVFLVTHAKCPVQISRNVKQVECVGLKTYDYFSGSEISFALTFLLVALLPLFAIGVLYTLAKIRNAQRQKQISKSRKLSSMRTVQKEDGSVFTAIEWENKSSSRVVNLNLGSGSLIKVTSKRNQILRIINTKHMKWITTVKQSDKEQNTLSLRLQREYDLILTFNDTVERETFVQRLKTFVGEGAPDLEIQEHCLRSRELFATAVTREARQKQLEKFFRAAFARAFDLDCGKDCKNLKLSATEIREIIACELSQTEFADALAMQANSPFVEQMFQLADKDRNGYISFREFLDIMFIFAKGTPEDKLKLFFDMYDVNGDGKLDREAFKKMMKSFMDVVNASVDSENLNQLVESMFTAKGGEKEFLNFEDFGAIMLDLDKKQGQGLLSDVSHVFQGVTNGIGTTSRKNKSPKKQIPSMHISRRGTVVVKNRLAPEQPGESSPRSPPRFTLARMNNTDNSPYHVRQWLAFTRYIANHRQHIFILSLYTITMFGFFIHTAYKYGVEKEHSGLRQVAGYGISVSRGGASAMMFTYSTLLVTMSRNTITFLRETLIMNWIPFDSAVAFHKYVAIWALFFTVVHSVGHGMNFYHFSTQSPTVLSCILRNDFHRSHELPKFHYYCWQTVTGATGVILCVVVSVMYVFATQYSRRAVFKCFWWTHQLYIVLYALIILHGSGHLLQAPTFHFYILGPAILFTVDKLISMARKKVEIPVTKAQLLPSGVTHLEFKRPVNFNYKSGQWVRIACLDLAGSEYHPFTLTSAPHEENLSLHIRAVGPWTMNLRNTYNRENLQDRPFPKLYLDGPFGEGHQDWYRFEVSVLVGGGIGVTPFASILKDIAHKGSLNSTFACKQVYFLWVTRTQKHFEWLTDIIREVEENDTKGLVTVHIFITQFYEKFDLRTTMLYICERHFQKISGRSLFTGLQSITHFGRPNFDSTLQSISRVHPWVGKIGVFSCGPPAMTRSVEKTCAQLNISDGPTFVHHFENF